MWIESHLALCRHPKTNAAIAALGVARNTFLGALHMLWWWAFEYAPSGNLTKFSTEQISVAAEWQTSPAQFVEVLVSVGFLDRRGERLLIHDWDKFAGKYVRKRRENMLRMRRARAKHNPTRGDVDKRREEKSTGQNRRVNPPVSPLVTFTLERGFEVAPQVCDAWRKAYPACDLDRELAAAQAWVAADWPRRRKLNWQRFLVNWLSRGQERGGGYQTRAAATVAMAVPSADATRAKLAALESGDAHPSVQPMLAKIGKPMPVT